MTEFQRHSHRHSPRRDAVLRMPFVLIVLLSLATALPAQCDLEWVATGGVPGTDGTVNAMVEWDPDGAGPITPKVVVGGQFTYAGDIAANHVALYDPATGAWSSLSSGCNAPVFAMVVMPNGDLVVGGNFSAAGGVAANRVARWNGTAWSALGAGFGAGGVLAMVVASNGDLICGGSSVRRWNGTSWSAVGNGLGFTYSLAVAPNGDLVAGGSFTPAFGAPSERIARWNGSTWSAIGSGCNNTVRALAVLANGDIVAGGDFTTAGGVAVDKLARWDGATWAPLSAWFSTGGVYRIRVRPNGDLLLGGSFYYTPFPVGPLSPVASWDGSSWSLYGSGVDVGAYELLESSTGNLLIGGIFTNAGGAAAGGLAEWDGLGWRPVSLAGNRIAYDTILVLPGGEVVAGVGSTDGPADAASRVARWDGSGWAALGGSAGQMNGSVKALVRMPNGDLVAGGEFTDVGGTPCSRIARWDGAAWSPLGSGTVAAVNALLVLPNGDLIAGGVFANAGGVQVNGIARWDGTAWSALGSGTSGFLWALALSADGDLIAGGSFATAGGVVVNSVARWDGSSWHALGGGLTAGAFSAIVRDLEFAPNGDLFACGDFSDSNGNRVARWDGTSWSSFGGGLSQSGVTPATCMVVLPGGDVVVGGRFAMAGTTPVNNLARWNGTTWSAMGGGVTGLGSPSVDALAVSPEGEVLVGGYFARAGGQVSAHFARAVSPCPASAVVEGSACAGAGGAIDFQAESLPWSGSEFRAASSTVSATGIGLVAIVTGFDAIQVPLAGLLPPSPAGCSLLVTPEVVDFTLAVGGSVTTRLTIPSNLAFVGQQLRQQLVAIDLDVTLAILETTSSNALRLTLGAF